MAQHLNKIDLKKFPAASSSALEFSASTDSASAPRLKIEAGGKHVWSDGSVVGDTNLYRSAADTLKTDDYFIAEGGMTIESYQVTTAGASSGTVLKFDGTKFAPGVASTVGNLDDLADVVISSPSTNQALIYDGANWVNGSAGAAGSTYVADIGNGASTTYAVIHGLNTRDVFVQARNAASPYEVIDVQWEATSTSTVTFNFSTPPSSNSVRVAIYAAVTGDNVLIPLDNLTDVTITAPEEFQSLTYNGASWVNSFAPTVTYVRNAEATTLTTGTVVYLFGATGDHATVKRASNTSDTTSSKTIGLVAAPINASENGPVVTRGYVDGIDLSVGYTAGDVLWLGTNGQFTTTKTVAPDHLVFVGVVVRATNNGIIYVATQNGYELDELHNVSLPSPQSGDFLKYNGSLWVADAIDLGTDTTGNYVQQISAGTGVTVTGSPSEAGIPIVSIGQAIGTSDSPTFAGITVGTLLTPAMYYSSMNSGRVSFGTTTASASAQVTIKSSNMTYAPLVLQSAMSQSANLQEWQDPTNLPLAFVSSTGSFTTYAGMTGASVSATTINKGATLASDTGLTLLYGTVGAPSQNADINVTRGSSATVGIRWNETTDKWQFTNDGTTYKDLGSGGITVSDTAPSTPATGDLWYESDTGSTYVYYDSYWIEIGGSTAYDQIIGTIQAKGDLLAGTASQAIARLAVGTNGTRLVADSTTATGLAWASDTQNTVIDAKGDLLVGLADNTVGKLTVGTDGQILVADSSQTTGVGWTNINTRNLLYNGAMQVHQRTAAATNVSVSANGYYTADRWQTIRQGTSVWNQSVENDAPTGSGFRKSVKMTPSTQEASIGASSEVQFRQLLEGQDLQALKKGTASAEQLTLQFWVKSNTAGTYVIEIYDAINNRHVGRTYTISAGEAAAATWVYKTVLIPADISGALNNDNANNLMIIWWLAAGANFQTGSLPSSWASASTGNRAVGQVNLASSTSNYWQITGVQLNVGPVAAPFEFKSYQRELQECQRYYYRVNGPASAIHTSAGTTGVVGGPTAANRCGIVLPVPMRRTIVTGDFSYSSIAVYDQNVIPTVTSVTGINHVDGTHLTIDYAASAGGLTAGRAVVPLLYNVGSFYAINAEL